MAAHIWCYICLCFLTKHSRGFCKLQDKVLPGLWWRHKGLSTKKKKYMYSHLADLKATRTNVSMNFCTPPKHSSACANVRVLVCVHAGVRGKGEKIAGIELQKEGIISSLFLQDVCFSLSSCHSWAGKPRSCAQEYWKVGKAAPRWEMMVPAPCQAPLTLG